MNLLFWVVLNTPSFGKETLQLTKPCYSGLGLTKTKLIQSRPISSHDVTKSQVCHFSRDQRLEQQFHEVYFAIKMNL